MTHHSKRNINSTPVYSRNCITCQMVKVLNMLKNSLELCEISGVVVKSLGNNGYKKVNENLMHLASYPIYSIILR